MRHSRDRKPTPSPSVELLLKALRIAGSTQKLAEWIQTPVPALNGETPYALMQSEEDRKQVDTVLSRIEHGIYYCVFITLQAPDTLRTIVGVPVFTVGAGMKWGLRLFTHLQVRPWP